MASAECGALNLLLIYEYGKLNFHFKQHNMDIKNRTALVTGSAKRVGREVARALARRGAHVVVHYNQSRTEAEDTVAVIESLGVRAIALQADVSKADEVARLFQETENAFGGLDILVTCAAVFRKTPLDSITMDDWSYHIDTNLIGTFLCCQHASRIMLKQQRGKIITIGDWAGEKPYTGYIPYSASKAGVINMTKSLAKTLAPHIQINCINPGPVLLPPDLSEQEKGRSNFRDMFSPIRRVRSRDRRNGGAASGKGFVLRDPKVIWWMLCLAQNMAPFRKRIMLRPGR